MSNRPALRAAMGCCAKIVTACDAMVIRPPLALPAALYGRSCRQDRRHDHPSPQRYKPHARQYHRWADGDACDLWVAAARAIPEPQHALPQRLWEESVEGLDSEVRLIAWQPLSKRIDRAGIAVKDQVNPSML